MILKGIISSAKQNTASLLSSVFGSYQIDINNLATYTFTISVPTSTSSVILTTHAENAAGNLAQNVSSGTWNGGAITPILVAETSTASSAIWLVNNVAAGSYTFTVTYNNVSARCGLASWTVVTPSALSLKTSGVATAVSGTGLNTSLDIPAGALGFACYTEGNANVISWTGFTVTYEQAAEGTGSRFSGAEKAASSSAVTGQSVTTSHTSSAQPLALAVVSVGT